MMDALTQSRLFELFTYDETRGLLIWKDRPLSEFSSARACRSWNTRLQGKPAGAVNKRGYREVRIGSRLYLHHRLVWLYHHGEMPNVIDHITGTEGGDRIENLRNVTQQENAFNHTLQRRNKSGVTGVDWYAPSQKWRASIRKNGRRIHLGHFETIEEATACRKQAEAELGFHPNHGRLS